MLLVLDGKLSSYARVCVLKRISCVYCTLKSIIMKNITTRLLNRTNNPLERYNQSLNDKCVFPHQSLSKFEVTLEDENRNPITRLENIR